MIRMLMKPEAATVTLASAPMGVPLGWLRNDNKVSHLGPFNGHYRFYEKVLNVKDDVAAILNSFFPAAVVSGPLRSGRLQPTTPVSPIPGVRADCGCVDC